MTSKDAIIAAMRLLAVLQIGESPSDPEASSCLDVLNRMLHFWDERGIKLHHVDLLLNDRIPYPASHEEPIIYNLGLKIAPLFGKDIPIEVAGFADIGFHQMIDFYGGAIGKGEPVNDVKDTQPTFY